MSFFPGKDPEAGNTYQCDAISQVIVPRTVDLGDFRGSPRVAVSAHAHGRPLHFLRSFRSGGIPRRQRASTSALTRISGLPPSPICSTARSCIATASAPAVAIRPGEVNWMTAGRGIVHSERTRPERRVDHEPIHGLQMWVALPAARRKWRQASRTTRPPNSRS